MCLLIFSCLVHGFYLEGWLLTGTRVLLGQNSVAIPWTDGEGYIVEYHKTCPHLYLTEDEHSDSVLLSLRLGGETAADPRA
jgi:hypothetical protein